MSVLYLLSTFIHIYFFNCRRGHLFDYTCAVIIYEMCVEEPTATVSHSEVPSTGKREKG